MRLVLTVFAFLLSYGTTASAQQNQFDRPAIAYSRHGVLTLATASGQVLKTIRAKVPIGNFAISADASKVVFVPLNAELLGGHLYLLSVHTGKVRRLFRGGSLKMYSPAEVYADPDFSPNGEQIVFTIRAEPTGDAVETTGPAAVYNLKSGTGRLLQGTLDVNGHGVAFANAPYWSPSGRQVLVNFESGAAITEAGNGQIQHLNEMFRDGGDVYALGWLGPGCIIYIAGKDWEDAKQKPARVLNLKSRKIDVLASLLNVPVKSTVNLEAVSPSIRIRREGEQLLVEGSQSTWTIPYDESTTFVKIVGTHQELGGTPSACLDPTVRKDKLLKRFTLLDTLMTATGALMQQSDVASPIVGKQENTLSHMEVAQRPNIAFPMVAAAAVPLYPPLARVANVEGVVRVKVTTDGHRVTAVSAEKENHPLLAQAAEDNARTWRFTVHEPTMFTVTYRYKLVDDIEPVQNNPRVTLRLPTEVEVDALRWPRHEAVSK